MAKCWRVLFSIASRIRNKMGSSAKWRWLPSQRVYHKHLVCPRASADGRCRTSFCALKQQDCHTLEASATRPSVYKSFITFNAAIVCFFADEGGALYGFLEESIFFTPQDSGRSVECALHLASNVIGSRVHSQRHLGSHSAQASGTATAPMGAP